jgi:hypothetical protein
MLHRLIHSLVFFLGFLFLLLASGDRTFTTRAAPQAAPAKHGLTASYYSSTGSLHDELPPGAPPSQIVTEQVWYDANDFQLPRPQRALQSPMAVRVDPRVAFGQGKGFSTKPAGPTVIWWPTGFPVPAGWAPNGVAGFGKPWDYLGAAIWKGYIHFPKAGTYYLATISNGPSAVYLDQARVALNRIFGGVLVSDAFSYAKEDIGDFVQNLYGGREDAALRPNPGQMYVVPVPISAPRDLPIEVAYNPMGGFTHSVSQQVGIDLFWVMPDSPRDANGKPIAKIVPADVLYSEPPGNIEKPAVRSANSTVSADFLYFPVELADKDITVSVRLADKDGHPAAGKRVYVSSLNDSGPDAIVQPEKPTDENGVTTARIHAGPRVAHDSIIFATDVTDLVDIAQVAHVKFQAVTSSSFFPVTFSPYYDSGVPSIDPLPLQVGRPTTLKVPLENRNTYRAELTVTFQVADYNIGSPSWNDIGQVKNVRLNPHEQKEVSLTWTPQKTSVHVCFRVNVSGHLAVGGLDSAHPLSASLTSGAVVAALLPPSGLAAFQTATGYNNLFGSQTHNAGPVTPPVKLPPPSFPNPLGPPCKSPLVNQRNNGSLYTFDQETGDPCTPSQRWKDQAKEMADQLQKELAAQCSDPNNGPARRFSTGGQAGPICQLLSEEIQNALRMWADPPDSAYRRVAVADSDSAAGYLGAWTKSWERYQAAKGEGDQEWMAKHATAIHIYAQRMVTALRREADQLEKQASQLPSDKPERPALLEIGSLNRKIAEEAEHLDTSPTAPELAGQTGLPLAQTYTVANPLDKQENVDLFIRAISIPPDWKLSIVNAEQVEATTQAVKPGGHTPTFPVREVEADKHYAVTLPAKAEVKVASVLIPVGELGANTTARWAVEGYIGANNIGGQPVGGELIGGMVHEMNVPYIIPDLKLPPVGSKETEEELPAPSRLRLYVAVAIAGVLILAVFLFFIFWRRRHRDQTAA